MKIRKAWLQTALAIMAGCAIQQQSPYPDVASLLNAPPPQNRQELYQQCIFLRQEMVFQRTKEGTAAITLPGTTLLSIQDEALRNIAALKEKSAKLGCNAVFTEHDKPATR